MNRWVRDCERLELRDMKTMYCILYSENAVVTCGQARESISWHKMKKKAQSPSPPDDDTLNHYLQRTNYITYCQMSMYYDLLEHPSPIGHGWGFMNRKCRPVRYTQRLCLISIPILIIPRDCI